MQKFAANHLRPIDNKDLLGLEEAKSLYRTALGMVEAEMANKRWAMGDEFTLADCAAAPALFYADWVHPIGDAFHHVRAYRARLLARPSVKRAVDEARPYRSHFPGGAPDRD
jgi:glutathione S-transferase